MTETCGFVFAATGDTYTRLAQKSARSVAQFHPDIAIDLYTDQDISDPVFSHIHSLSEVTKRPRMYALVNSRFEKSIYLDADTLMVAPVDDVFMLLDRFDLAIAQDQWQNSPLGYTCTDPDVPAAFPQYNAGVMGVRNSEGTRGFISEWDRKFRESGASKDQPLLRELLYKTDLKLATLPAAYNLLDLKAARAWSSHHLPPRIIHHYFLHFENSGGAFLYDTLEELLGKRFHRHLQSLLSADRQLHNLPEDSSELPAFIDKYPGAKLPDPFGTTIGHRLTNWIKRRF